MSGPAWKDVPAVMFMATSLRDVGGETFVVVISNNNCRMRLPWKFFTTPLVYFISQSLFSFSPAIEQAEALMKHAYMLDPANPHTLLTSIHTLEVRISLHSTATVSNKFLSTLHTLMCCFSVTI